MWEGVVTSVIITTVTRRVKPYLKTSHTNYEKKMNVSTTNIDQFKAVCGSKVKPSIEEYRGRIEHKVIIPGLKTQRYYDAVERLRKKSQQKVDVVQKLLSFFPNKVPR